MTRPNDDDDNETSGRQARRRLLRLASAVAALALIATLTIILLAGRSTAPDRSVEAFCRRMNDVSALSDALASGDSGQIDAATTQLRGAAAVAPAEVEAPIQVLVAYADGLESSVATAGHDQGAVDAALADAVRAQQAQIPAVEAAGQSVQSYTQVTCGIDLTKMTGTTATADATTP